ncbi:MAG: hypothetical protein K6W08_14190 [Firmicutes bacterium]|nr:hypothetical protein [Bacillota bacterium]
MTEAAFDPGTVLRFLRTLFGGARSDTTFLLSVRGRARALTRREPLPLDLLAAAAAAGERIAFSPALRTAADHDAIAELPVVWVRLEEGLPAASVLERLRHLHPVAVVRADGGADVYWRTPSPAPEEAGPAMERLAAAVGGVATTLDALRPLPLRPEDLALDPDAPALDPNAIRAAEEPRPQAAPDAAAPAHAHDDRAVEVDAVTGPSNLTEALFGPLAPIMAAAGADQLERITIVPGRPIELLLRGEPPLWLDAPAAEQALAHLADRPRTDSAVIEGNPYRLAFLPGPGGQVAGVVIRFARPASGVAEPLRALLEAGKHLLVLGAAGPAKTDLLRDIGRILAEPPHRTVAVVDLFGELGGPALAPHPALGRALRLYARSYGEQARLLLRLSAELAPDAVVVGRIGGAREAEALRLLAMEGVQVVAALPCQRIAQCVDWPGCYPLLGLQAGPGARSAVRAGAPVVDATVELLPTGAFDVRTGVAGALDAALGGPAPLAERGAALEAV